MSSFLEQHAILIEPLASTHDVQVMYVARAGRSRQCGTGKQWSLQQFGTRKGTAS